MKILLINQTFFPDIAATAQYLTDFSVHLAESGHEVTVLAGRRNYLSSSQVYQARENYRGVHIVRVWSLPITRKFKWLRILDAFLLNFAFAWKLMWMPHYDQIVAMTTPPLIGWMASYFARWRNSKFIYWVMDINPDQAVEAGWLRRGGFRAHSGERILSGILKRSDQIIVLDRFMKENLILKGASAQKIEIVPPWSQDDIAETVSENQFRQFHQLGEKFVVMYSGNFSICHPLDTVLGAALHLKHDSSVRFVFIGGGARLNEVLNTKRKNELSHVMHIPYQERGELRHSLAAADIHVVVMGNSYTGIVHPSKIYGIIAAQRPFIFVGPAESPIGEIIREEGIGWQVEHGDIAGFVRAINEIRRLTPEQRHEISKKYSKLKNTRFNQRHLTRKLTELLSNAASS